MPDRPSKKKPGQEDLNEMASRIVSQSTDDESEGGEEDDGKDPAAVELGRRGGKKGGRARADKLTPEERQEIARRAARVRWARRQDPQE